MDVKIYVGGRKNLGLEPKSLGLEPKSLGLEPKSLVNTLLQFYLPCDYICAIWDKNKKHGSLFCKGYHVFWEWRVCYRINKISLYLGNDQ